MGQAGFLLDRQGVHVGAQADHRPLALTLDDRHDSRLGDPLMDLGDSEPAQLLDHEGGGLVAIEPGFRVLVQMPPPGGHVVGVIGDTVQDGHGGLRLYALG